MTDAARAATAAEPDGAPRIGSLDVMRGMAILGILFMNIDGMGAAAGARNWAMWIGAWTPLDKIVWFARMILADGTARCMLELLFGAGMVILTGRSAEKVGWWRTMRAYYWRNIVLFALGMAHVFLLLWYGDILHIYAICALIVFPLRKLPSHWLIAIGLLYTLSTVVLGSIGTYSVATENLLVASAAEHHAAHTLMSRDERAAERSNHRWHRQIRQARFAVARENANRTANFRRWQAQQVRTYVDNLPKDVGSWVFRFAEAAATMLIGAGLFKLGILQGQRSRGFYLRLWLVCYLLGGTIRAIGAWQTSYFGDGISLDWSLREVGRLSMTLGHVGLIGFLLTTVAGSALLKPFSAAGRTALTIYICQTLICLWLLYPPFGLALYGKQGWAALMATAVAVNAVLLIAANIWVRYFRIAPVEWLWRSIVEFRALPFRNARNIGA